MLRRMIGLVVVLGVSFQFNKGRVYIRGKTIQSLLYLFLVWIIRVLGIGCSGPTNLGDPPAEAAFSAIVDTKCVRCHYKTRIFDALGTKSVSKWEKTIKFMKKQGTQLTDDEQNKLIACFSSLPKGSNVVCQ